MPRAPFRLAIATACYPQPLETPMTAHAGTLFGGSSIIICRTRHPDLPSDRPRFALDDVPDGSKLSPRVLFDHISTWRHVKSLKTPVGARKKALEHFLLDQSPDAILIEQGHEAKYFWHSAKRLGIPVFVYFRGIDATGYLRPGRRQASRIKAYREMMKHIDGIFSVSQFLIDELAGHGISHPNTNVLPSGVDIARFTVARKQPGEVLMAGRLIEKKAPLVAIDAFLRASENMSGTHLHVVGDGPLLPACKALVQGKGTESRVSFHGHLDHLAVADMMAQTPIFIQHSVTSADNDKEGAPTSIQEAMASGMCIVSTRHAGIPHLVEEGKTGFLVAEHDADAFTRRLGQLLETPELCAAMGREARRTAELSFDKAILHARLETVLRTCVADASQAMPSI